MKIRQRSGLSGFHPSLQYQKQFRHIDSFIQIIVNHINLKMFDVFLKSWVRLFSCFFTKKHLVIKQQSSNEIDQYSEDSFSVIQENG